MFGTAYSTILYLLSEVIAFTPHIASKWDVIHSFHFIVSLWRSDCDNERNCVFLNVALLSMVHIMI